MIKLWINSLFLFVFVFGIGTTHNASAQFINLQITIEPELSASVEQHLNFGTVIAQTGEHTINLGDANMGIFSIKTFYTQNLYIDLLVPDYLTHSNPAIKDNIPISLSIAYNNSENPSFSHSSAVLLENNSGYIPITQNLSAEYIPSQVWKHVELYVFGSIYVGDISNGEYSGEIVLNIEYN